MIERLSRREALRLLAATGAAVAFAGVLSACGGGSAISASPASTTLGKPSSSAAAEAYTVPSTWDQLLAAAKAEGKVVVTASPDVETRQQLPAAFTKRFGIQVDYLPSATDVTSRLQAERAAGQFTLDAQVNGPDSIYGTLYPNTWIDPFKSALLLPEAADPSKWKPGGPWFRDPGGDTALQIFSTISNNVMLNLAQVAASEFPTAEALLDPKWKGKICAFDPGANGGGLAVGAALYLAKGEEYVTKLYKGQQVALTRDYNQAADWLAHGTYPIGLAVPPAYLRPYIQAGLKFGYLDLPDAPNSVGGAFGIVVVMNKAPHPNAARVFANWMVTPEALTIYAQAQNQVPVRNDVDPKWMPPELVPKPGVKYVDTYDYKFVTEQRLQIREFYQKMLK
ncbi:MAG TPA: extracellular solute-binding protein [Chloroflexota bacterium]